MRVIDLTHTIKENMPVYPGIAEPKLTIANSYEQDGFRETMLHMTTHTGTHIDPPAHLLPTVRRWTISHPNSFWEKRSPLTAVACTRAKP